MKTINIPVDFTMTPGTRKIVQGPFSGELFRKELLDDAFLSGEQVKIIFDGALGYPPSFLEEAFGQLTRDNKEIPEKDILARFILVSENDPKIIKDVTKYILEARKTK